MPSVEADAAIVSSHSEGPRAGWRSPVPEQGWWNAGLMGGLKGRVVSEAGEGAGIYGGGGGTPDRLRTFPKLIGKSPRACDPCLTWNRQVGEGVKERAASRPGMAWG